jgi:hypothetical protein
VHAALYDPEVQRSYREYVLVSLMLSSLVPVRAFRRGRQADRDLTSNASRAPRPRTSDKVGPPSSITGPVEASSRSARSSARLQSRTGPAPMVTPRPAVLTSARRRRRVPVDRQMDDRLSYDRA